MGRVQWLEEDAYERFVAPINLHGAKLRPMFVESERIAATIHKVAEDEKVDLKVISTRGRSRSAAILLGSVTEGVIVLTEFIVPATDTPGAKAAKYIDLMLHDVASEDRGWIRELIRKTSKLKTRKKGYDKERLRHRWAPCCRARPHDTPPPPPRKIPRTEQQAWRSGLLLYMA